MANYQTIIRLRPEIREFIRHRLMVHRGEAVTYGPNVSCDSFSTDGAGFRHSTFKGETLSAIDCVRRERYGLVLGASNVFGLGLAGNANTMPSLLAERFGFPFANIGLPEGNSRNLFSILLGYVVRAHPPAVVVHLSGGDFTNFCYTSIADPVFGSPNLKQIRMVLEERGGRRPSPDRQIQPMLAFTTLWTRAIAEVCRTRKIALVLGDDTSFFEKGEASKIERDCELGKPFRPAQERQFAIHKKFAADFDARRKSVAAALGIPLAGQGLSSSLGFIDEFHYDRDGTRALCDDFAEAIEPLL